MIKIWNILIKSKLERDRERFGWTREHQDLLIESIGLNKYEALMNIVSNHKLKCYLYFLDMVNYASVALGLAGVMIRLALDKFVQINEDELLFIGLITGLLGWAIVLMYIQVIIVTIWGAVDLNKTKHIKMEDGYDRDQKI